MAISFFGVIKGLLVRDATDTTKLFQVELDSAASTGTKTILKAAQTGDRTISLPDATDTLVGKATTDVLTNKTIDGDDNTVQDLSLASLKTDLGDADKFLVRDGSGDVISNTKDVPSGDVVGTSDTQVITNKDIDGGTASNSVRLTAPKNTLVNLNALNRKEGTIVYDTTNDVLLFDDGTNLVPSFTGADTYLSNLTSPTEVNQDLIPDSDNTRSLGSALIRWQNIRSSQSIQLYDALNNAVALITNTLGSTPSGNGIDAAYTAQNDRQIALFTQSVTGTSASKELFVETGNNSNAVSGDTGDLLIKTGDVSNAGSSGSTGSISLTTGTPAGSGDRGSVIISSEMIKRGDGSNFVEEQYFDSISLASGQTDSTISELTFAHASYEAFEMLYKVKESTSNDVRVGRLMVATDGTNVSSSDTGTETASTGITFDAAVSGANIIIRYSSGGNGATLRADVRRIRA